MLEQADQAFAVAHRMRGEVAVNDLLEFLVADRALCLALDDRELLALGVSLAARIRTHGYAGEQLRQVLDAR